MHLLKMNFIYVRSQVQERLKKGFTQSKKVKGKDRKASTSRPLPFFLIFFA